MILRHALITNHYTHTHTRLTAFFLGVPGYSGTRKVKPIWILLKQETVSGSSISCTICKSASHSRQIFLPATHRSVFLQARCPSCRPTNSVKALKAQPLFILFQCPVVRLPHQKCLFVIPAHLWSDLDVESCPVCGRTEYGLNCSFSFQSLSAVQLK